MGHEAAFSSDKSEESSWMPMLVDADPYLRFTFDDDKLPTWVRVFGGNGIRDFALEHSDDGIIWYRDAEYRVGCFERYNQYLGQYLTGGTTFYTRRAHLESVPEERLYKVAIAGSVYGYLTKAATKDDTIVEVSDPSLFTPGEWIQLSDEGYTGCYQIKEMDGNRLELFGKVLLPNGFPEYSTIVRKLSSTLMLPYGFVTGTEDYAGNSLNGLTVSITVDGITSNIVFSGFGLTSTAYEAALFMNTLLTTGSVEVINNKLRVVSNTRGTSSYVNIVSGTALSALGLTAGTGYGAYDVSRQSGTITLRAASFTNLDLLAISYTALDTPEDINQWYSFRIPQYLREPVRYWQIKILDTWYGADKELAEIELHGDEYYPRQYRHERIGLFLDFGSVQPGCTADVCNKPVTDATLAKLRRNACTAIPAGYEMVVGVLDCHYRETMEQRINLFESFYDVITTL
jgi:hypothetical protein